jgi:hypothetical protein
VIFVLLLRFLLIPTFCFYATFLLVSTIFSSAEAFVLSH